MAKSLKTQEYSGKHGLHGENYFRKQSSRKHWESLVNLEKDIKKLRDNIDRIDSKIVSLLRRRFLVAKEIGKFKKNNGLKIRDSKRERELLRKVSEKARKQGIKDLKQVKKVYLKIIESCREIQRK